MVVGDVVELVWCSGGGSAVVVWYVMVGVMVVMWWWYWMMWLCGGVMRVVVWCGVDVAVLWTLFRTRV